MKKIVISLLLLTSTAVYAEEQQWSGPDFLIIGAQKSGTTALYNYLIKHPQIQHAAEKEIHFFDTHFEKGIQWYQQQFKSKLSRENFITGEATPYYLFHPLIPQKVFNFFPNVKLIILLRNPIDRAFSQYKMLLKQKNQLIYPSFEEEIAKAPEILKDQEQKLLQKPSNDIYSSQIYRKHSLLERGKYINQIKRWLQYFPKEQFLILLSDDLLNNPAETVNRVFRFLDLPEYTLPVYPKYHVAPNNDIKMKPETREMLTTLFRPFNQELQDFLNNEFGLDIQLNWN